MIFHIAVCAGDPALRAVLRRHCEDYFARRATGCSVVCFESPEALLARDAAGGRYELYLLELTGQSGLPAGLAAAMELRQRGRREPLAFAARSAAWAYYAYRADAMQYLLCPVRYEAMAALLDRAVQPEYAPALALPTAAGLRGAALRPDRICGVHPARGPLPPDHRGGGGLPVPAGAFFAAGRPSAGRRAVRPDPPVLPGQPGGGAVSGPGRSADGHGGPAAPAPRGGRPPSGRP